MTEIPADLLNSMLVASISFFLAVWLMILLSTKKLGQSLIILAVLSFWYGLVYFLGQVGFWAESLWIVPFIAIGFITLFFWLRFLYHLPVLQNIASAVPVHWLVGVQVFRFMGIGFLSFYALGLIPGEFALPTGLGDVFIGVTAVPVAILLWKKLAIAKKLAIWWNYLGIFDLSLALFLGNITFPRPIQVLHTTPDNLLIAMYPLVISIPLFAVPLSILLHLFALRALKKSGSTGSPL